MVTGAGQGVITYALGLRAGEGGSPSLGPSLELAIGAGEMGCSRQQRRHSPLERQDEKALRPSSGQVEFSGYLVMETRLLSREGERARFGDRAEEWTATGAHAEVEE